MKKLITLLFTISCFLAGATDLYVMPGAPAPYYSSIGAAVTAASDGDRIIVAPGSYVGNVTINQGLTIMPLNSGGTYTIVGNVQVDGNSGPGTNNNYTCTTIGAIVNGNIEAAGSIWNHNFIINLIDCEIIGTVNLNTAVTDGVLMNLYYSTFNASVQMNSALEIIGNDFLFPSYMGCIIDGFDYYDFNNETLKIIGNRFFKVSLEVLNQQAINTANSFPKLEKTLISNNYFNDYTDQNRVVVFGCADSELLFENNTIRKDGIGSGGHTIEISNILATGGYGASLLNVRNNIILMTGYFGGAQMFELSGSVNSFILENNFFGWTTSPPGAIPVPPYTSTANGWWTNLPSIFVENQNTSISWAMTTADIDPNGLVVTGSSLEAFTVNQGKDIIDCRDIDDTRNDLGVWGGPHSYDNYHLNPTSGQARVIDIDIPFIIYPLPGVSFDINAKTINTNQ